MPTASQLVAALLVATLLAMLVVVVGLPSISDLRGTQNVTLTHEEGQTLDVRDPLRANATAIDAGPSVDVEISNSETGETATASGLSVGAQQTLSLEQGDITVELLSATAGDSATVSYRFAGTLLLSDGTTEAATVLGLLVFAAGLLLAIKAVTETL